MKKNLGEKQNNDKKDSWMRLFYVHAVTKPSLKLAYK